MIAEDSAENNKRISNRLIDKVFVNKNRIRIKCTIICVTVAINNILLGSKRSISGPKNNNNVSGKLNNSSFTYQKVDVSHG